VVVRMGGGPLDSLTGEKCQFKLENLKKKVWHMDPFTKNEWVGMRSDKWCSNRTGGSLEYRDCVREFRYTPLVNCFELAQIFEGVSASGDHAFYPSRIGSSIRTTLSRLPSQYLPPEPSNPDFEP